MLLTIEWHRRVAQPAQQDDGTAMASTVKVMLRQLAAGGISGAVATLPMSALIWGAKRVGIYRSKPAPEAVSTRFAHRLIGRHARETPQRQVLTSLSHVGFGSGAGAMYGATAEVRRPSIWTGMLFGLAIWFVSYKGWLPALRLMPPPEHDEQGRTLTMVTAHLVYGAALGLVGGRMLPNQSTAAGRR
jgi:hypothetical protein